MGSMTFHVVDAKTGAPVANAEVTANYNTSPCEWYAIGCTSGDGQQIQGYTGADGKYVWSIPYTCAGSFTAMTAQANGYSAQTINNLSFGANPGSLGQQFNMVPSSVSAPPGQGAASSWDAFLAALGYGNSQTEGQISGWLGSASLSVEMILGILAVIVIAIAVIFFSATHPGGL